jgi:hypothetical protein
MEAWLTGPQAVMLPSWRSTPRRMHCQQASRMHLRATRARCKVIHLAKRMRHPMKWLMLQMTAHRPCHKGLTA